MVGRCISQNELAKRWHISEATLERWRSQRKGPQFLRLGGQVRYRLADVEAYELEKLEVVADCRGDPFQTAPPSSWVKLSAYSGDRDR
jgi:predicted DNA-binding transcriptional regulator AlpA